jgi:hypothetical protein
MKSTHIPLILFLSSAPVVSAAYNWSDCHEKVRQIQDGNLTMGSINSETIDEFIYHGTVTGLVRNFSSDQFLAITYEGSLS